MHNTLRFLCKLCVAHISTCVLETTSFLVEKTEAHVVISFLFRLFLLGFSLGSFSSGGSTSSSSSSCSGSGTNTGSNVVDEFLDAHGFKALGEETRPKRLDINVGSLEDGVDFFGL